MEYIISCIICFVNPLIDQTFSIPTFFHGTFYMVSDYKMVEPAVVLLGNMINSITWEE